MKPSMMSRLAVLEAACPEQAWRHTAGLWSLLRLARARREAGEDLEAQEADTGLGRLLREARRRLGREGEG